MDALRRYARILTRDADGADDLVQGTLVRGYERLATFRDGADLRVWLMALQHNLFIDLTRSRLASQARERAWAELTPGFSNPEGDHAVRLTQLRGAFPALPKEQREVLHLVALEDMSMAEVTAVISVPVGTVRVMDEDRMARTGKPVDILPVWLADGDHSSVHYELGQVATMADRLALVDWHRA